MELANMKHLLLGLFALLLVPFSFAEEEEEIEEAPQTALFALADHYDARGIRPRSMGCSIWSLGWEAKLVAMMLMASVYLSWIVLEPKLFWANLTLGFGCFYVIFHVYETLRFGYSIPAYVLFSFLAKSTRSILQIVLDDGSLSGERPLLYR